MDIKGIEDKVNAAAEAYRQNVLSKLQEVADKAHAEVTGVQAQVADAAAQVSAEVVAARVGAMAVEQKAQSWVKSHGVLILAGIIAVALLVLGLTGHVHVPGR
jgi:ribosomal protein L11 methylase PrmA